ncbi:MAG: type II toxin-antitoxin system HicB family antitoxin [Ktedonobacterales bacterium]
MSGSPHYSIVIEWSDEDQTFVVLLPEWAETYAMPVASGKTYEEAAARGRNALENYIQFAKEDGKPLPEPRVFAAVDA